MNLGFLIFSVFILSAIVLLGFFNEKVSKLTYEIALMLFAVGIGAVITVVAVLSTGTSLSDVLSRATSFNIEKFLMDGALCFMLFAGSCHMKLSDFKRLARPVGVLSIGATLLGAVFYGLLFYGVSAALGLGFTLPMCLMFGSVVAPTDPIAATSILNKFGLPKDTSFIIEGESLLNDGVGVALFVCFSGMVTHESGDGFFTVMLREILGAAVVGLVVSIVLFQVFKRLSDEKLRIFTSLLSVALSYLLCEFFDFSGAIASVVCGVAFSYMRGKMEEKSPTKIELKQFDGFWEVLDSLMNSVLYVMMGLSFIRIMQMEHVIILSLCAIVCNFIGRFGSVYACTFFTGKLPDGYTKGRFSMLLTWGGLRGGLSIALAMSTVDMLPENIYHIVLGCAFAIAFFTTVVQGLTMRKVYARLSR